MGIADRVLAADDHEHETMEVPEWDVTIELRCPALRDRAKLQAALLDAQEGQAASIEKVAHKVIAEVVFDPDTGERAFTPEQAAQLSDKNGRVVERVALACFRVAGLAANAVESGKGDS